MSRYNFSYTKRLELALFGSIRNFIQSEYPPDTDENYINFMACLVMDRVLNWEPDPYIVLEKDFKKSKEEVKRYNEHKKR